MPRYSPQDIDRACNEALDAERQVYTGTRTPTPRYPLKNQLPEAKRTGRPWKIGTRRHGSMATLDDMERRR